MKFDIQWHITDKCNMTCSHCYNSLQSNNDLSHTECIGVMDEISTFGRVLNSLYDTRMAINFTGGEPLIRDDILDLIEDSNSKNFETKILTNGILLTEEKIRRLKELRVKFIQISIDDIGESHDLFRKYIGAFEITTGNISKLVEDGFKVNISCTISKINSNKIKDLITMAIKLRVNGIKFGRLIPIGNATDISELLLTPDELKNIFTYLYTEKKKLSGNIEIILDDPLFNIFCNSVSKIDTDEDKLGGCSIGLNRICITANGDVLPCRRLPLKIGNVKKDALRDIWFNSEVLNNLRTTKFLKGKCRDCKTVKKCFGCPAISYAVLNDYLEYDPQCWR